ncbi:MAG: hypothetical protein M1834_001273 [Cirrosporium novae-zelandiae]|nr:MAG: hypothetical protein M1834_001273 [Cirrosporium novae-zelandiae]
MAGLEQLEIHSRSYLVRWVNVKSEWTISWSINPHKKSVDFGLFKHPGHHGNNLPTVGNPSAFLPTPPTAETTLRNGSGTVPEKLKSIGLQEITWVGKCEAHRVTVGTYNVPPNEGGMYALVFDNTFSKQTSKTVTFVLMTYATKSPPLSVHNNYQHLGAGSSTISLAPGKPSPALRPTKQKSVESLQQLTNGKRSTSAHTVPPPLSIRPESSSNGSEANFITGILQKRRRKKHQGYARRFFSLDYGTATLSYYQNRDSSALRGAIPLALAAVGANEATREISIDSGAEVWHLKALNKKDFETWKTALEKATSTAPDALSPTVPPRNLGFVNDTPVSDFRDPQDDKAWEKVEALVGRISGTRDAVRRLAVDTDPKYLSTSRKQSIRPPSRDSSPSGSNRIREESSPQEDRRPFWKRKPSNQNLNAAAFRRSVSTQHALPTPPNMSSETDGMPTGPAKPVSYHRHEHSMHDHCMELLQDLDAALADFATLIAETKQRRGQKALEASRASIDSDVSQEFFDAVDADGSQLLRIHRDSNANERTVSTYGVDSASSSDDEDEDEDYDHTVLDGDMATALFPPKPKSLTPLPLEPVPRRDQVAAPKVMPPSLIGFLRKNVGKDLSSIAMPVSANEPTSLLQRVAENFEYSTILDVAASEENASLRLIHVAAFAISTLSNVRIKERAIRKPFNPMLGETFELVREDRGFRLIAEKVSHHPVQLAYQAESKNWSLVHSPMPSQKFWGKSAELLTDGVVRLSLHAKSEHYSWLCGTQFLRNVIAGEKYLEPVGTMTITNDSTMEKAVITFKSGGMFSGRSEEVVVSTVHASGEQSPYGLIGKWTESLHLTENNQATQDTIWKAGPLVQNPALHYGFTTFAASLNDITPVEQNHLPPTDSRLRPDQRAVEDGDLDTAEDIKATLEDRQRSRRRQMQEDNEEWKPRWFMKSEVGEEILWKLKGGKDGYWEERAKGEWTGVVPIFALD